ncbi:hypothetical protein [Novipirellula sp.]|uniref:hypothetical protein n=1 Tax=Novipirellula sp. TaxID=2795430 RepID=UPI003564952F
MPTLFNSIDVGPIQAENRVFMAKPMSTVSIRYMIDDVPVAIQFYTTHLGFALDHDASPAFALVTRDGVRLLLSGKTTPAVERCPTVVTSSLVVRTGFTSK